jgi:hypothetical protein
MGYKACYFLCWAEKAIVIVHCHFSWKYSVQSVCHGQDRDDESLTPPTAVVQNQICLYIPNQYTH